MLTYVMNENGDYQNILTFVRIMPTMFVPTNLNSGFTLKLIQSACGEQITLQEAIDCS